MAKKQAHKKNSYSLLFLFPGGEDSTDQSGFLPRFRERLNAEQSISADHPGKIPDGYVAIFDASKMESQVNPGEFMQLGLPETLPGKCYWDFFFSGKNKQGPGGLIIHSDVLKYLLKIYEKKDFPGTALIRLILHKLNFRQEKLTINQEPPFGTNIKARPELKQRMKLNLSWNTSLALKEARFPELRKLSFSIENPLFRLAFFITALIIFIILPILSLDAGLSGDDTKHYQHAAKVFRYFTEDDPAALNDTKNKLNFYGQSFDFFTSLIIRLFGLQDNAYEARHVMVALSGAAAILCTGLLVKLFSGYSGGLLAMLLMFLSPRFLGHAFNNPMDIPFALGNIFALYHLILFLKKLPGISIRHAIWIAVGIGWANGIRIGGLLLVPYIFMFAGLYVLFNRWPWKFFSTGWWSFVLRGFAALVGISLAGYLLSLLTWPYALQDIVNHPIKAFKVMSDIQVSIRVLYNGMIHWSDKLPWHYIPRNMILTIPVLILLGWLASIYTWISDRKEGNGFFYFILWFTLLFPVLFIIYRESNVYGGWRHMLFIYPSMVALAAISLSSLIGKVKKPALRYALIGLLLLGIFHPMKHIISNHPNTYIYFNELSGGINKTAGSYETDYYTNSLKPASDFFIDNILPQLEGSEENPIKVVSNFSIDYYFREHRDRVKTSYSRYYDRGKYDWDYAILYCNYLHPSQLRNGMWPPKNTIYEVKVDTVVVAAIVERKNRDDHKGSVLLAEAMQEQNQNKLDRSLFHLQAAVEYDPSNEIALLELGNAYSAFLRFEEARSTMDKLLEVYPNYDKAYNIKGYSYLIEAEVRQDIELLDKAIKTINLAINSNFKFYSGYYNLGLCYAQKDDRDNAEYNLKQAIRYNARFKQAYVKLAELYEFYGDDDLARQVRARISSLPG